MKKFELSFSFKGARQYVHGTDMLNKSSDLLCEQLGGDLEQVGFVIHRMTDSNLSLIIYEQEQAPQADPHDVAVLKFLSGDKPWEAHLVDGGTKPDARYPYDEAAVAEICEIDEVERKVVLEQETPYTAIETLVAMTKELHLKIFPNMTGNWVFCRWDSPRWPLGESLNGVCIQLKQTLGTRLTKAEVSLGDKVLGHIYFSARNNK